MTTADAWSDADNDAIVASYFAMLRSEVRGEAFSKAERRRALEHLLGRSKGSIEFKHQNISAVLLGLGQPWIKGYPPASRFQASLVDAVLRWLEQHPDWAGELVARRAVHKPSPGLQVGPAPHARNAPRMLDLPALLGLAQQHRVAERDARNRALGEAGERLVLEHERCALRAAARDDLAGRVRWVAKGDGDGVGYDIASFDPEGVPQLIEVKTTTGWEYTPFHITRNELDSAQVHASSWLLFRVYDFARLPKAFELRPPLDQHLALTPSVYIATIRGEP